MRLLSVLAVPALYLAGRQFIDFLPEPAELGETLLSFVGDSETYAQIGLSLSRLLVGLGLAIALGLLFTIVGYRHEGLRAMLAVYLFVAMTVPSLAVAIIALLVFGISQVGVYVAIAVITFPFVTISLEQGLRTLDANLVGMAKSYRIGRFDTFRHLAVPHMSPYIFAALRNVNALGWKVLVVAEVFSVRDGIGGQFSSAFDNFALADVFIWLLFFLAVVMGLEYLVLRPVERRIFRWRDGSSSEQDKRSRTRVRRGAMGGA